jgi:hypothetical protein
MFMRPFTRAQPMTVGTHEIALGDLLENRFFVQALNSHERYVGNLIPGTMVEIHDTRRVHGSAVSTRPCLESCDPISHPMPRSTISRAV